MGAVLPQAFAQAATPLPSPATSGIDHIVVLMMENRSSTNAWQGDRGRRRAGGAPYRERGPAQQSHLLTNSRTSSADPDHPSVAARRLERRARHVARHIGDFGIVVALDNDLVVRTELAQR